MINLLASVSIGALRYPGTRLIWDGPSMTIANVPEANQYVQHAYRQGWAL